MSSKSSPKHSGGWHLFCRNAASPLKSYVLVGTAGTVTTLGAIFLRMERYDPSRLNGLKLEKDWVCHTLEQLAGLPIRERRGIPGIEEGREDIIVGGILIVREILSFLGKDALIVSDAGLLEGLLFRLVEERLGGRRSSDALEMVSLP